MARPFTVGITGGIGSGKTVASRIFAWLGIAVYNADQRARQLMETDPRLRAALEGHFGKAVFRPDGHLNRTWLGQRIFSDESERQWINQQVHPAVGRDFTAWARQQTSPYCLNEAALLIESGRFRDLDRLIVVTAPEAIRLARVMERDRIEEAEVRARMARQLAEEQKQAQADFLLHNDGRQGLIPQVVDLHHALLREASAHEPS